MSVLAPVVLFTYKRFDTLKKTVESLQQNYLASETDLYIFSDAAKSSGDKDAVDKVRKFINKIDGFKTVTIFESKVNKGLASSIIDGVSSILKKYSKVIVLEDDLVSSRNFLNYMNEGLNYYRDKKNIFSIAGFSIPIIHEQAESDVYFTSRSSSWGWATWDDRWGAIDWEVADYDKFKNNGESKKKFNKMGSDMSDMLDRQMNGKINSWAIRWCYHQFKNNLLSVHPLVSKIENIGFNSPDASNTKEKFNRYETILDSEGNVNFLFSNDISLDLKIIKQFVKPFSIKTRIKYKLLNLLFKN